MKNKKKILFNFKKIKIIFLLFVLLIGIFAYDPQEEGNLTFSIENNLVPYISIIYLSNH